MALMYAVPWYAGCPLVGTGRSDGTPTPRLSESESAALKLVECDEKVNPDVRSRVTSERHPLRRYCGATSARGSEGPGSESGSAAGAKPAPGTTVSTAESTSS